MDSPDLLPATATTVLLCLCGADAAGLAASPDHLHRLCSDSRHDVIAVGWGPPESAEDLLRDLAGRHPRLRIVLHARPVSRTEALCAGVQAAGSPWILLPGTKDVDLSPPEAMPGPGVDCVPLAAGSILFSREAFARLPRIPGMARWLPELFAQAGLRVVPAGKRGSTPWLRRVQVAVLCTMAGIAAPAASRA